jgi:hypothetical protein
MCFHRTGPGWFLRAKLETSFRSGAFLAITRSFCGTSQQYLTLSADISRFLITSRVLMEILMAAPHDVGATDGQRLEPRGVRFMLGSVLQTQRGKQRIVSVKLSHSLRGVSNAAGNSIKRSQKIRAR